MDGKKKPARGLSDAGDNDSVLNRVGQTKKQSANKLTSNIADTVRVRNVQKMGFIINRRGKKIAGLKVPSPDNVEKESEHSARILSKA